MKLFLDLEGTIINDWFEPFSINTNIIRNFISDIFSDLNIFSFAINDKKDLEDFNLFLKSDIMERFERDIDLVPTVEDVKNIIFKNSNTVFDIDEVKQIFGKERGFIEFCRNRTDDDGFILIDDVVENLCLEMSDKKIIIVNVKDLENLPDFITKNLN